jgi:hypothetical protein
MRKKLIFFTVLFALILPLALSATVNARGKNNPHPQPIVYVTGQGLFYDSIVLKDLPPNGPFQLLEMDDGPTGLRTEFGLGDPDYVGGRWWVDVNDNGEMDSDDAYFLCPLLGPGRSEP